MTICNIPEADACWNASSLLGKQRGGHGARVEVFSPADGSLIQSVSLLDQEEIAQLVSPQPPLHLLSAAEMRDFTARLHESLRALRPLLMDAMQRETAFVPADAEELVEGSLSYVERFCYQTEAEESETVSQTYMSAAQWRQIRLERVPWGTIVVILPQNAFLLLAVTCLLNALATGNWVILRAPLQSARSAALLATAVELAQPPQHAISIVLTRAREFLAALYASPLPYLIHYMGSSRNAPDILADAFRHGKASLMDGEGNGWVWVGADACPEEAARWLTEGALRYNGQTCTSINGAMIHPALFAQVRERLLLRWQNLHSGDPLTGAVDVGPLFDVAQAEWCEQQLRQSNGTILCGGQRQGNLLFPTLIEDPHPESGLVTEGLFGPGLWIASAEADTFVDRWRHNRYPLCAGVFSPSADSRWWSARLQNLARLMVNGDLSQEFLFEPWGGYPASGMNPVGNWKEKYQRVLQIDAPAC